MSQRHFTRTSPVVIVLAAVALVAAGACKKPAAPAVDLPGRQLIEWGGALRWFKSSAAAPDVRAAAVAVGGTATLFRGGDKSAGAFHPLAPATMALHRRLKQEFDPKGIFTPGRMYAGL